MGLSTISSASRERALEMMKMPYTGFFETGASNSRTVDSAAAGTAIMSGMKTNLDMINIPPKFEQGDKAACTAEDKKTHPMLFELAIEKEMSVGVVTNGYLTGALVASAYARTPDRKWRYEVDSDYEGKSGCQDIAQQLITFNDNKGLHVAMGGGRHYFQSSASNVVNGKRTMDLIEKWQDEHPKGLFMEEASHLNHPDLHHKNYLLGLFAEGPLDYKNSDHPSLKKMTSKAIDMLSNNPNGYILVVVNSNIDQAHHSNQAKLALMETLELDKTLETIREKTSDKDTLVIVTADHDSPMVEHGENSLNSPVWGVATNAFGDAAMDDKGRRYTQLAYGNGPGNLQNITSEDFESSYEDDEKYQYPALFPLQYATHSPTMVPAFASGPGAHHLSGVHDQTELYRIIEEAIETPYEPPLWTDWRAWVVGGSIIVGLVTVVASFILIRKYCCSSQYGIVSH